MSKTPFIKSISAAVMLVIFTFSITPKRILHDLFANHKDKSGSFNAGSDKLQLTKAAFYCHCDDLVSTSPFEEIYKTFGLQAPSVFIVHDENYAYSYVFSTQVFFELRGPPACSVI